MVEAMKKIVLGFPSGDTVKTDFMLSFIRLLSRNGHGGFAFSMANKKSCYVDLNRNMIANGVLTSGADALLFLDTDMVVPDDIHQRLWAHGKDIVGCDYVRRHVPYDLNGLTKDGLPLGTEGLRDMARLGMGAILIRRKVFETMPAPWFWNDYNVEGGGGIIPYGEDTTFCHSAQRAGFTVWCDQGLSREVSHEGSMHFRIQ